jgi:hypothetical protein
VPRKRDVGVFALTVFATVIAPGVAAVTGDSDPDVSPEFYAVMAQVIPVLILALMLEVAPHRNSVRDLVEKSVLREHDPARLPRRRQLQRSGQTFAVSWLFAALLGESCAVYAVATGASSTFLSGAIVTSALIIFGGFAVVYVTEYGSFIPDNPPWLKGEEAATEGASDKRQQQGGKDSQG